MTSVSLSIPAAPASLLGTGDETRLKAQISEDLAGQLRAHDITLTLGNLVLVLVTAAVFQHTTRPAWLVTWLVLQVLNAAFHLQQGLRWLRRPINAANTPGMLRMTTRTSLINGLLWTVGVQIFWPGSSDGERMLLVGWMMGITASALHALHAHLPAYIALSMPCMGGIALALLWHGGFEGWGVMVILGLYMAVVARFAWSLHRLLLDSLRQRHQVTALANALRMEKDRAVNLSQSRSRFLAAASHDLRQPVHALSLFVGALRQNPSAVQSELILNHVSNAVDAMGAMFTALLDISKLDADLLKPDWQVVELQALLERIAADHTAIATAKGLDFRCDVGAAAQQFVRTDAMLLERILRNLLSNAMRYTAQGTVAIKVRVRHGRAEILVADTGVGIDRAQREQVFEEFVQLNAGVREGEQGLGLGLSIVRRLASLLHIRLVLRSRPGRGTVFALRLPLADTEHQGHGLAATAPLQAHKVDELGGHGVVIVIDDSVEIQLAMRALLSGWGYDVFTAASVPELMAQAMSLTQTPRLLLCDYRLHDGENGISAIEQLQEEFNHDIPAILITADTGPERLREAVDSGLLLLHKPVTQSQLYEAITKALAQDETMRT